MRNEIAGLSVLLAALERLEGPGVVLQAPSRRQRLGVADIERRVGGQ
jgi:hypothetical protein